MAYTFSEYPATTYYAQNKTDLQDVLQLLPDNTAKEITPRDVRDAVLSAWESNVFKYSSVGGSEYIGFTRDEIKDKKIFFGKKQISGSDIMSSSLLTSQTDVFLYNTKSDTNPFQYFRMGFLAGTDTSLFGFAPYIQSTQVSGGNPYISLNLINPATYGTITIQSGSSASVVINDLYWPSTAQVAASILSPSPSIGGDLFLVMSSPNNLELKTYTSVGDELGTLGFETNIYGTPVKVNNVPLEYTNPDPIIQSIGGVTVGTTFSSLAFSLLFDQILYPTLGPFALLNVTTPLSQNRTLERNHISGTTPVVVSYSLTKRTNDITLVSLKAQKPDGSYPINAGGATFGGPGLITNTYPFTYNLPNSDIGDDTQFGVFTFSVIPSDGTYIFTASQTVEFVYPYIYSFNTTDYPLTSGNIPFILSSYTKVINSYGSQSIPLSNPTTPQYLYFMYPSNYGLLSEILDDNGFSESLSGVGASWTFSQNVSVTDPTAGNWQGLYNIYKKTQLSTMPTSQNYKFNF